MMKNKTNLPKLKGTPIGITLLMLFFALSLTPQLNASSIEKQPNNSVITISGYVTYGGERISDVTIESESTNDVTISDREGKFSISAKKGGTLVFQKNGYTPFEHIANNPNENLIVCLFLENDSVNADNQQEKMTNEEKESIINIKSKKKR